MDEADKIVRYCPECGHIGAVKPPAVTCCPDSCGMSMKRWQAEKLERVLDRARGQRRSPPSAPRAEAVEASGGKYLTVVYRDIRPGDEARELLDHPKMSAASWSHALHERDAMKEQNHA